MACRHARTRSARALALNLSVSLVALLVALALAEVILHLAGKFPPGRRRFPGDVEERPSSSGDSLIGWTLVPFTTRWDRPDHGEFAVEYRANSVGFRDDEFTTPRGGSKIAFLGDSFTFGAGVAKERTFTDLIESRLAATAFNLGISGHGVSQMWLTLVHYALPLDPDLVIVTFVADDMRRSVDAYTNRAGRRRPTFRAREGRLELLTEENRPGPVASLFHRHSRLLSVWRWLEWKRLQSRPGGSVWRVNRALFEAIRDRCSQAGVELLVVYLPTEPHGGWELGSVLAGEFADMGTAFLDLTPVMRGRAEELFFRNDPHINARGHEVVADAILRELSSRGVVEPAGP